MVFENVLGAMKASCTALREITMSEVGLRQESEG